MSRLIEDRLAAALDARAELVTPQDLRPLEVPTSRRRPPVGVLLLAAAASAAVIATPFLLQDGSRTTPAPGPAGPPSAGVSEPTEPEPTEPSEPGPSVPADATAVDRQRADVDGDGRPDRVRLLLHTARTEEPAEGSVEVLFGTGGSAVAEVPFGYPGLEPALDLDGDGRDEVLLSHTEGGDSSQLLVYTWHDGGLVLTRKQGDAPLGWAEGGGYVSGYYTDDRGLISWASPDAGGTTFEVEEWSWSVEGDRLVPTAAGTRCKDVGLEPPRPC